MKIHKPEPVLDKPIGEEGLNSADVALRVKLKKVNRTPKKLSDSYLQIVLKNLFNWFNIILFAVAIAFLILGIGISPDSQYGLTKYGFLIPVFLNLFIGIFQQCRAKKIIDSLAIVTTAEIECLRDGKRLSLKGTDLVIDDLIFVKQGQQVPVDGRILSGFIDVDESILTGEQKERRRTAGEKLYAGSIILSGEAKVRVTAVGLDTYSQKLQAGIRKTRKPKAEMIKTIDRCVLALSILIVPLAFLSGWMSYRTLEPYTDNTLLFQEVAVSVGTTIVGAIPTGLVLLASARCALSVIALYKENTSVKELKSVEGLAQSQIVCLDKTGTLTTGKMEFAGIDYLGNDPRKTAHWLSGLMANVPDTSETAAAIRSQFGCGKEVEALEITPFNSKIKHSGCVFKDDPEHFYGLGAPQFLLPEGSSLFEAIERKAKQGLRVLAFIKRDKVEGSKVTPLALLYLKDEIRPSAFDVIKRLVKSKVQIRIISGDDPSTVSAIALRLGIPNANLSINMRAVNSADEINRASQNYAIFGRTTPEQKRDLIKSMQAGGNKVTMVIDALNDILAAKAADCSICIAHEGGSDAATQVADVTILDGDFSHMPAIIKEGRKSVNDMLRSSTLFLMKSFLALGLAAASPIFGHIPYSVEGLYLVTWFVTGVGGFILGLEDTDEPVEPYFGKRVIARALPAGIFLFLSVFIVQLMVKTGTMPFAVVHPHMGAESIYSGLNASEGTGISYQQYLNALGYMTANGDSKVELLSSLLFIEEPVCIIAAVIAAFTVMIETCQPFTKFRLTALGICLTCTLFAMLVFPVYFLGADNIPSSQRFAFVAFWSKDCYYYHISRLPAAWVYLLVFGICAIPLYWGLKTLSEHYVFKTSGQILAPLRFVDMKTDDSLKMSIYNLFGKVRMGKKNGTTKE